MCQRMVMERIFAVTGGKGEWGKSEKLVKKGRKFSSLHYRKWSCVRGWSCKEYCNYWWKKRVRKKWVTTSKKGRKFSSLRHRKWLIIRGWSWKDFLHNLVAKTFFKYDFHACAQYIHSYTALIYKVVMLLWNTKMKYSGCVREND